MRLDAPRRDLRRPLVTDRQRFIAIIAAIITLPILFATIGGGRSTGLTIGVVLVVVGLTIGLLNRDEP